MKIRSITIFAEIAPAIDVKLIKSLGAFAQTARQAYEEIGIEVQTTRLAMNIFPALAQSRWADDPAGFAIKLEETCLAQGFEFIALGPAEKTLLPYLPKIFAATKTVFATAHIIDPTTGAIDGEAIRGAARVIRECAQIEDGFGNLRFSALAHVPPNTPFFPAAYHDGGAPAFAIATQSADLAVNACTAASDAEDARCRLIAAVETEAARLVPLAKQLARAHNISFGGIDFSLAPFPAPGCSIGAALELLSGQPVGSTGTLTAAAVLTAALDQARFPHTGFCGMMLPVLEDEILARRAAEGRLRVGELLQWSAVCGTGLDTVPLPGDASEEALARLLYDVAALSARWHKPLTARLMPLPSKSAGDSVHFDFAYFADGGVLSLDGGRKGGLVEKTASLVLHCKHNKNDRVATS